MLIKYKNDIYRIINDEFKINTSWFEAVEKKEKDNNIFELSLRGSKLLFQFINPDSSFDHFKYRYSKFNPSFHLIDIVPRDNKLLEYTPIVVAFKKWMNEHAMRFIEESEAIDRWTGFELERNIFTLTNIESEDNTIFNSEEQNDIQKFISSFKQNIIVEFNPSQEQLHSINNKLDHLINSSNRIGRKDWKLMLISTIIQLALTLSIGPETGKKLFELFKSSIYLINNIIDK